jgi:hypothetical protein
MAAVSVIDGVKYGFVLLGYFIAVFLTGGVILGIGAAVSAGGTNGNDAAFVVVGGLLALVGGLVVLAGLFGVLYKIIADGVGRGIESSMAAIDTADTTATDTAGTADATAVTGTTEEEG